jgi:hypothetical protein
VVGGRPALTFVSFPNPSKGGHLTTRSSLYPYAITRGSARGAGFGGLELAAILFGRSWRRDRQSAHRQERCVCLRLSKLDVMLGWQAPANERNSYRAMINRACDFSRRRDPSTRPPGGPARGDRCWNVRGGLSWWGLVGGSNEFHSVAGGLVLPDLLPRFGAGWGHNRRYREVVQNALPLPARRRSCWTITSLAASGVRRPKSPS